MLPRQSDTRMAGYWGLPIVWTGYKWVAVVRKDCCCRVITANGHLVGLGRIWDVKGSKDGWSEVNEETAFKRK